MRLRLWRRKPNQQSVTDYWLLILRQVSTSIFVTTFHIYIFPTSIIIISRANKSMTLGAGDSYTLNRVQTCIIFSSVVLTKSRCRRYDLRNGSSIVSVVKHILDGRIVDDYFIIIISSIARVTVGHVLSLLIRAVWILSLSFGRL